MEKIKIKKESFPKQKYPTIINTEFSQLINPSPQVENVLTVDEFFELYDDLFYEIQPTGEVNSHEYMVKRSGDYVGLESRSSDVDALIQEINDLRRQLLEANQNIIELSGRQ